MNLEDYFDFESVEFDEVGRVDTIRVKGSRIGIEHIVEPYLQGDSPERIFQGYRHSLSLEQVYATITYYLANRTLVDGYLRKGNELADYYRRKFADESPSPALARLREMKAAKKATQLTGPAS